MPSINTISVDKLELTPSARIALSPVSNRDFDVSVRHIDHFVADFRFQLAVIRVQLVIRPAITGGGRRN